MRIAKLANLNRLFQIRPIRIHSKTVCLIVNVLITQRNLGYTSLTSISANQKIDELSLNFQSIFNFQQTFIRFSIKFRLAKFLISVV